MGNQDLTGLPVKVKLPGPEASGRSRIEKLGDIKIENYLSPLFLVCSGPHRA